MKTCLFALLFSLFFISASNAQYAAQKDASYVIIAKVIADYKLGDAEYAADIESLRENQRFNQKLEKMLAKVNNNRSKDAKNQQILKILEKAGKDIDRLLGVN